MGNNDLSLRYNGRCLRGTTITPFVAWAWELQICENSFVFSVVFLWDYVCMKRRYVARVHLPMCGWILGRLGIAFEGEQNRNIEQHISKIFEHVLPINLVVPKWIERGKEPIPLLTEE